MSDHHCRSCGKLLVEHAGLQHDIDDKDWIKFHALLEAQRAKQQPAPQPGHGDVFADAHKLLDERQAKGAAEYGCPTLQYGNGRKALKDAVEEAADLLVYLMQAERDMEELRAENQRLTSLLRNFNFSEVILWR